MFFGSVLHCFVVFFNVRIIDYTSLESQLDEDLSGTIGTC